MPHFNFNDEHVIAWRRAYPFACMLRDANKSWRTVVAHNTTALYVAIARIELEPVNA